MFESDDLRGTGVASTRDHRISNTLPW
jgi:hypothetical protein